MCYEWFFAAEDELMHEGGKKFKKQEKNSLRDKRYIFMCFMNYCISCF